LRKGRGMCAKGSVTGWFGDIQGGDSEAVRVLWERYYPNLVRIARERLRLAVSAVADEEDVAASAMESFFRAAEKGRFPNLADRYDLWRLLLQMTRRKVCDLKRRENRQRRGGGQVRNVADVSPEFDLGQIIGDEPTPEFAAMMTEECRRLLDLLDDPDLVAVAIAKMEGYRNREIAQQRGYSERTVERELELIRRKWEMNSGDER